MFRVYIFPKQLLHSLYHGYNIMENYPQGITNVGMIYPNEEYSDNKTIFAYPLVLANTVKSFWFYFMDSMNQLCMRGDSSQKFTTITTTTTCYIIN